LIIEIEIIKIDKNNDEMNKDPETITLFLDILDILIMLRRYIRKPRTTTLKPCKKPAEKMIM